MLVPLPVLSKLGPVDWQAKTAEIRSSVLTRLRDHGIFISDRDIVTEQCFTPADWESRFGLFDGSAFGAAHDLTQMGPFRPANWSKRYSGLFYVGSGTTPGAGMPMVVLGGKMTAERVSAHVR